MGGIGERYFAAANTVATTTIPIVTPAPDVNSVYGTGCWKCDAMSYTTCASEGYWQDCSNDQAAGDSGVCFIEMRETSQELTQLCTGCKDSQACDDLKAQNFVYGGGSRIDARNQCKSDWRMQRPSRRRYGVMQSTCRQCFSMCTDLGANDPQDTKGNYCFGGLSNEDASLDADLAAWFKVPVAMGGTVATSTGLNTLNQLSLGIPLHAVVGSVEAAAKVAQLDNKVMWGDTTTDADVAGSGKIANGVGTGNPITPGDNEGYLFWTVIACLHVGISSAIVIGTDYKVSYKLGGLHLNGVMAESMAFGVAVSVLIMFCIHHTLIQNNDSTLEMSGIGPFKVENPFNMGTEINYK